MIDQFYTPPNIATAAIRSLGRKKGRIVADFTVGDGSLLRALSFAPKTILGLDLNSRVISKLKKEHPNWVLETGNLLEPTNKTSNWLLQWKGKVDIILLNPPFSCRGGTKFAHKINENEITCRTALTFIIRALQYMKPSGVLIGIVPLSLFRSEGDSLMLAELSKIWEIEFGNSFDSKSFVNCSSKSIILKITRKKESGTKIDLRKITKNKIFPEVEILRGTNQMFKTFDQGKYKVIHTTNLENEKINRITNYVNIKKSYCPKGEYLFISRVGNPNLQKIGVFELSNSHAISDCIIAIKANPKLLRTIKKMITKKWNEFSSLYQSTCAPYITIKQLSSFFYRNEIQAKIVNEFSRKPGSKNLQIKMLDSTTIIEKQKALTAS